MKGEPFVFCSAHVWFESFSRMLVIKEKRKPHEQAAGLAAIFSSRSREGSSSCLPFPGGDQLPYAGLGHLAGSCWEPSGVSPPALAFHTEARQSLLHLWEGGSGHVQGHQEGPSCRCSLGAGRDSSVWPTGHSVSQGSWGQVALRTSPTPSLGKDFIMEKF